MSFDFGQECKKHQIDQAFAKQVDKKLFPLLERAIKIDTFNYFISKRRADFQNRFENSDVFFNLINKIRRDLTLSPKEFAFVFILYYLVVVESLYTLMVDVITFALINVGKELKDPRTDQLVILSDELERIALGTKLDFLRANRFKIIADRCDISLRNTAAHLNFTLDDDGNITFNGHIVKVFDDMNKYQAKIREAAISSFIALRHFYYEKYGKYMP